MGEQASSENRRDRCERDNRSVNVRWIQPGESTGAQRGDVVVCIPVYGGHEHFVSCLHSVLMHTPAQTRILICDDASPDARSRQFVEQLGEAGSTDHQVLYARQERNVGFPANVNAGFASAAPGDVVIVNSDCVVGEGWLRGLRDAAYADSRVASATALTNHGSIVSVPERGKPRSRLPADWTLDQAAAMIRRRSLRIRPRLPTAIGHCLFVRRSALELVGDFDPIFTPGYGEEVDFSQRCLHAGLCHVLADDVLVHHHGGGSFSEDGERSPIQDEHEQIIAARYPYYHETIRALEEQVTGPLARALSSARRVLAGLSVAIDARILSGPTTGTQLHVLELITALARTGEVRVTAIIPDDQSFSTAVALRTLPDVRLVTRAEAAAMSEHRADLVHRPYQINHDEDLSFLAGLGERLIVTNQDLIGYHNPSYFSDYEAWDGYRRTTRTALAVADRVVFFSAHARDDALSEDLVEPERTGVIHIGVDHTFGSLRESPRPPRGAERLPDGAEAILCIGTDFRHKNRIFALQVLDQLRRRHDWAGYLLLVGPTVEEGSSQPDEAQLLALSPTLAAAVIDFAAVSEAQKAWVFERAGLVLYPSVHEGFGLVPFEAADHDVPCMWAPGTSLSEVLPDTAAAIVPWNAAESADRALELLRDAAAREANLQAIRTAASALTWDATAARLLEVYHDTCDKPATPASALERRHGLMHGALSEDAMRLLGPGGALPADVERPLLALATHPQIGAPMFRVMKAGYRASYALRRARPGKGGDRNGSAP
jgi:GT2 family glycosyltransferase/glycosyltransferase involved in cell wall biosynthesis